MKKQYRFKSLILTGIILGIFLCYSGGAWAAEGQTLALNLKVRADRLLKHGETEQAIWLYEKLLRHDSRLTDAYYNLATAYYVKGEVKRAIENLETFVRFRPQDAEAFYNLGCLKIKAGAFEKARASFQNALKCPLSSELCQKIKEALLFMKDLQSENPETQKLIAYLLTGSVN